MASARSSKGPKGSTRLPGEKPETVKLKITVGRETARVLRLEAFGRDCSLGSLVEELVRSVPRRFTLTERGSKVSQDIECHTGSNAPNAQDAQGAIRPLGLARDTG